MANQFQNYIDGEWVGRIRDGRPIAIRPISSDVIGEYAQADDAPDERRDRRREATPSPPGRSARSRSAPTSSTRSGPTSSRARTSIGRLLVARRRQDAARGHRRDRAAPATSSSSSPAKCCGWRAKRSLGAAGRRRRDHARADRRRRPDHAVELPDRHSGVEDRAGARLWQHGRVQAGPAGRRAAPGRWPRSSPMPACRPACSTW